MKWEDYIEDKAKNKEDLKDDAYLLYQQILFSLDAGGVWFPGKYKIGWYIESL